MKPSVAKNFSKIAIQKRRTVLWIGAPGIGKSDIVSQAAEEAKSDLIIMHPVVSDPTDAKGMPWVKIEKDGTQKAVFIPFHELQQMIDAKKSTVVFLDDLGQAPPAVQASFMQLLLARRINGHQVSDHVTFFAATNRNQDLAGVTSILEPVKSRFKTIIELTVDTDDWVDWAFKHDMPINLISFIRMRPELLSGFKATRDLVNSPCPRTIASVGEWMNDGLDRSMAYEVYSGAAGEGFATELVAYLEICDKMPNPDLIIMNPDTAPVPSLKDKAGSATMYALCGALASKSNKVNFDAITKYAFRIPPEFQVFMIKDSIRAHPELANTQAFIQWGSKNKDVLA